MTSLAVNAEIYRDLLTHLASSEDEQVAFLFTAVPERGKPLEAIELYRVPAEGFNDQSPFYLALSDETRAYVFGRATELDGGLVEAHSHLRGPAGFSRTDLEGFEEWVPHVRWRLPDRPYVALVFAGREFDALVWNRGKEPGPLGGILIDGVRSEKPTGFTHECLAVDQ
jgi:hypothetical protein